jgi:hypothetical protein
MTKFKINLGHKDEEKEHTGATRFAWSATVTRDRSTAASQRRCMPPPLRPAPPCCSGDPRPQHSGKPIPAVPGHVGLLDATHHCSTAALVAVEVAVTYVEKTFNTTKPRVAHVSIQRALDKIRVLMHCDCMSIG